MSVFTCHSEFHGGVWPLQPKLNPGGLRSVCAGSHRPQASKYPVQRALRSVGISTGRRGVCQYRRSLNTFTLEWASRCRSRMADDSADSVPAPADSAGGRTLRSSRSQGVCLFVLCCLQHQYNVNKYSKPGTQSERFSIVKQTDFS